MTKSWMLLWEDLELYNKVLYNVYISSRKAYIINCVKNDTNVIKTFSEASNT